MNKVVMSGYVGNDPDLRYTQNQTPVANFSLATSERVADGNGGYKDVTDWHRITVWGKMAETCSKHVRKGSRLLIEGKIKSTSWEDKTTGAKQKGYEVNMYTMEFLGASQKSENAQQQRQDASPGQQQTAYDAPPPDLDQVPF